MTPDTVAFIVVTTISFTVVLYFAWSNYQNQRQWQRKRDQEDHVARSTARTRPH